MESVACPLCCEDRFSNQDLLKYHLLSLTTNIQCPFCGKQCDDINSLVVHLDKICNDKKEEVDKSMHENNEMIVVYPDDDEPEPEPHNEIGEFDNLVGEEDYQNDDRQTDTDVETGVKKFIEEFTIDDPTKTLRPPETTETEILEEPNPYHCSECNIHFPSVQEHINNCHKGQDVVFQVIEDDLSNALKDSPGTISEQIPQLGTWIKWGNGYFYTNHKDVAMKQLVDIRSEKTTTLKTIPEDLVKTKDENIQIKSNVHQNYTSKLSANIYSNHCITDSYGDRYFDIPVYLLHQVTDKVNDYFQVEARKLSFKKRIRLIRLKSNTDQFHIEQILFQNKPTNCKIIPILEIASECSEYSQLEKLENCLLLTWKCLACNVKSDHWSKLNKHNCIEDDAMAPKSKKNVDNKNPAIRNNSRTIPNVRSKHTCPHCGGEFDSEGYLRTHLMVHINDSNKCPFCDQPVAPEMMDTHLIAHQNPEFSNLKFLCNICNKCYDSEFRLRCHQRAHEMRRKPREILVCDVCNAQFNDKNSLKHHAITHIEPPERLRRLHECRFCGKTFVKPIEKVNHERVHTGEKPFACPVCGRCFRLKDLVQKHMRVHTKERPYKCRHEGCEKTFSASSSRVNHEQGHSGIKQFKCFYCPRYFKNWVSRSNHVQEHMVQHKCDICDRSFVSFCNYKKHLKMHADGRLKFSCILCRQAFGRQLFLDTHMSREHEIKSNKEDNITE
ncbi:zinc finger protein 675-like [Metopolophium dirhodum]|uniref:zinc finger protein 675-like n=1 Tax=Metopolophium dirhodum TaxID=44670 RepID=UPI00298FF069|nr:zinc finger protein 675-like [Metopolophium dirhodum]XP_060872887.1 zinc finger protein 675-like [Metopolophium dirhodum]